MYKATTLPACKFEIVRLENKIWIVVTNIAVFLGNPNFPNGYTQEPQSLYNSGQEKYYAKVKQLRQLSSWFIILLVNISSYVWWILWNVINHNIL